MARKRHHEEEDAAIDMTPMLDIVFIMLIFFIVTTSFVKEAGIEVDKPQASQAKNPGKNANIFIAINNKDEIWMDKRQVDVERVKANIEKMIAEQPTDVVIIQGDKNAKHGLIMKVMDQVKMAGIDRISVAAEK
jgi:biopolymer transport protein ExbD